jgi:4-alpha-glucanotransferase
VECDALIDELCDLQHDLGKYILLPLSFLPADAPAVEIRAALRRALSETRSNRDRVVPARELWREFQAAVGDSLEHLSTYAALRRAVERALAWEEMTGELDRAAVTADLAAVRPAVRAVIDEVKRGR